MSEREQLIADVGRISAAIDEIEALYVKKRNRLEAICDITTCDQAVAGEDYFPGGYLDTACTTYHIKCAVCGQYKDLGRKSHGYYG